MSSRSRSAILEKDAAEIPLSSLMGRERSDWTIWASDDALPFMEQLGNGMREHGIPWLERVSDPDGFAQCKQDEGYSRGESEPVRNSS